MSNRPKYPGMGTSDNVILDATSAKKQNNNNFERNSNMRRSDQQKLIDSKLPQVYGEIIQTPSTPGGDEIRALIRDKKINDLEEYAPPPKDDYHVVYIILLINGIGVLMPWNMFITARSYFMDHKFKGITESYAVNFLTYVGVCAHVPNLLMCFINTFIQPRGSLTVRILTSLVILIVTLVATVSLAMVDSQDWPKLFFGITLLTVIFSNAAVGVYQNCVYGIAADLPMKYTACVVLGSNICGTLVSVLNIVSEEAGRGDERMAAIYYFLTALFVVLVCFDSYFVLPYCRFYLFHKKRADDERAFQHNAYQEKNKAENVISIHFGPYISVFKEVWVQCFNIFFVFFVTLAIFPAMQSDIERCDENFFLPKSYFISIGCFLFFNFFAMLGNLVPHWIQFPGPRFVWIPVLLRGVMIPYFFFCNYRPNLRTFPVYIKNDWAYLLMGIFMAFTSGYFSSLVMMYAPRVVDSHKSRMAAMLATFFLVLGIVAGVNFSWVIVSVNENLGTRPPLIFNLTSTTTQAMLINGTTVGGPAM